jgi:hypothetical protein
MGAASQLYWEGRLGSVASPWWFGGNAYRKADLMRGWILLFVTLLVSGPLHASGYEQGREAYLAGDYTKAFRIWQPLAAAGDAMAQFGLGQMYFEGKGVEQDYSESTQWFRKAAEQGFAPAQFNLGNAYKQGRGVERDDLAAAAWWRRAAEQGVAGAQFNLGTLYYFGRGVPKDEHEALEWYRRAAKNGHAQAKQAVRALEATSAGEAGGAQPTPAAVQQTVQQTMAVVTRPLQGEDWIVRQAPNHYTVQVVAARQEETVLAAVRRLELDGNVAYFRFSRQGEPWYAGIYGAFETRREAQAAVASLPQALRMNKPWVRRLGAIQALIERRPRSP